MDVCKSFDEQSASFYSAGICLKNADRHQDAISYFEQLLASDTTHESGWINKAQCEIQCEDYQAAEQTLLTAQKHCPDYYPVFSEYANIPRKSEDWHLAAQRWMDVCKSFDEQSASFYSAGICLKNADRHQDAISYFEQLLASDPTNESGWLNKAQCEIQCEDYRAAEKTLLAAQKHCPDFYPVFSEYANIPRKSEDWHSAAERWMDVCKSFDEQSAAFYSAGTCLKNADRHQDAISYFEHLLEADPTHESGWFNKAQCEIHCEDYQAAERTLLTAQKHCPDYYPVFSEYANIPRKSQDWHSAAERWMDVCSRFKEQSAAFYSAGICLKNADRHQDAISYFEQLLESDPTNESGWINKAQCEIQCSDYQAAEETLLAAQKRCPDFYPVFSEYANIPKKDKNWNETATRWMDVCKNFDQSAESFYTAAVFLTKAGCDAESLSHLKVLLSFMPSHEMGIFYKATCLLNLNQYEKAEATLLEGINKHPDFLRYHLTLANLLLTRNRLDEALEIWTDLAESYPDNPQCRFGLAVCFMKLKMYESASPYFAVLLASAPDNKIYRDYSSRCQDLLNRNSPSNLSA